MMTGMLRNTAALLVLAVLAVGLAGCGKKGPLKPRVTALPAPPQNVQIVQQGDDFLLSWTIPDRYEDGTPLDELLGFHVYRLVYNAAEGCPSCQEPRDLVADILLHQPAPAVRLGERLYWRDAGVAPGTGHAYLVVPTSVGGYEGGAAAIHRAWQLPPPPPREPALTAGAGEVRLDWTAPVLLTADQQLLGYNLYRTTAAAPYPPVPLNREPLHSTGLVDRIGPGSGAARYRLTTVVTTGDGGLMESAPTPDLLSGP